MRGEKPWRDVSYSLPSPAGAKFKYYFEAPFDEDGVPELAEALIWCEEHFGGRAGRLEGRWAYSAQLILFEDQTDAMVFKIRWC